MARKNRGSLPEAVRQDIQEVGSSYLDAVDTSARPDESGGEVQETEVVASKLVEARGDAPKVLDLTNETLD